MGSLCTSMYFDCKNQMITYIIPLNVTICRKHDLLKLPILIIISVIPLSDTHGNFFKMAEPFKIFIEAFCVLRLIFC
jgi:hypothetical protein